jgi:molybdopterin-containing oxidoreductase family iron-sulfur binding subunit
MHPSSNAGKDDRSKDATTKPRSAIDLPAIRQRLAGRHGKQYWRSLEELAGTADFQAFLHAEFPEKATEWLDPVGRRQFLKIMGASLALAGVSACTRQPAEEIFPYVRQPEQIIPGEPLFFATAMPLDGYGRGVLVESHMGRPTKVEGNGEHPASLGATDVFAQASVLTLYDPDRSQVIRNVGEIRPWDAFVSAMRSSFDRPVKQRRLRARVLTGSVTSPTLAAQLLQLQRDFPLARWHQYAPVLRDGSRAATRLVYGEYLDVHHRFDKASVILALDADFLSSGPASVRSIRDVISRRRVDGSKGDMNRLYVVEPTPTNTGAMADHRLPLRAAQVHELGLALATRLGLPVRKPVGMEPYTKWIDALTRDLEQHRGDGIVIAGEGQPAHVHALAYALNHALANVGTTVFHTSPIEPIPTEQIDSLQTLVDDMEAGEVDVLLIVGGNPVYDAPADLRFAERLARVPTRVHLSLYDDETSEICHWHIPAAHYLESWSDIRAFDGTATILQPLIAPLYDGKTAHELLAVFSERPQRSAYEIVQETWRRQRPRSDFDAWYRKAVHDGVVSRTRRQPQRMALLPVWTSLVDTLPEPAEAAELEIVFRPDPSVYDGQFSNNAWLQELPKAITRLTWDNAALLSPATAERLGLANEDVVELQYESRMVRAPVWISPGHADDSVTVHLGYGRRRAGSVAAGAGFDAYALRTSAAPLFGRGLKVRKTGEQHRLASAQHHHSMEGRDLVRTATLEEYRRHPHFARPEHGSDEDLSLYPKYPYDNYAWGMSIDLSACVGCNACVVACQSENNIPVVGKPQVLAGREMHWIRIDRYYEGALDNPSIVHQPVPCMHCERAPCEVVCPVNATVHGDGGLNEMVYNRCVGTRYCSNNCPYKVRRFNYFLYTTWDSEPLEMLANPDVTVRSRGVMEKCTYCVQRINSGRIQARKEDRRVRDGEVVTACQAACPADAIVFGDLNDPKSKVVQRKADPRNYALLAELGTEPRTTYIAGLRNPNPEIG